MSRQVYNILKNKLNEDKNIYIITIIYSKENTILINKILKFENEVIFEDTDSSNIYKEIIQNLESIELGKVFKINENIKVFIELISSKPHLVICGGGHIALPLCNIGKMLDFDITIIDNRKEFANKNRFPLANTIICNDFEKALKDINYTNSYFVIVTRGHKDDILALKCILNSNFKYIGMIGSKAKVESVRRELYNCGFTTEDIEKIHAPIGLKIKAQTPAEISISIMGEIINYKNSIKISNIDDAILDNITKNKDKIMLITILNKNGSSPRAVGTKMLVIENGNFIGTIGGGILENVVYNKALELIKLEKSSIENYDLSNSKAANLGMVCGGQIKVLFEYIP